ncbi:MAG: dTDP-4-dehydrorhamnose reductase [Chitinophagaceae bacterium]|nr:MAG: dTDP-4-dehydrorhamnose reductase [Chitinophagaceae bacterium]
MKIAVIGSNGQLGSDLCSVLSHKHEVLELTHADIEISDVDSINQVVSSTRPDIILNTAAYHVVPEAENYPQKAFSLNAISALNLARVCQDKKIRLLHYSTDYVFDGLKNAPYVETDRPNPLNVYAVSKLAGEQFVLNYCERSMVVRVSGIYGKIASRAKGNNFVSMMLKLAKEKPEVRVVNDEFLTPTPTLAIAKNTAALIEADTRGLFHMSCSGEVSWYEFARHIWDVLGLDTPLFPASVKDFPAVVKRPYYSVLENKALKDLSVYEMPEWREALTQFLLTTYK